VSEARRQTRIVYEGFMELANGNGGVVEVGDLVTYLRGRNRPMGAWEVRGELSTLQAAGLVAVDEESASWRPVEGQDFDSAYAAA